MRASFPVVFLPLFRFVSISFPFFRFWLFSFHSIILVPLTPTHFILGHDYRQIEDISLWEGHLCSTSPWFGPLCCLLSTSGVCWRMLRDDVNNKFFIWIKWYFHFHFYIQMCHQGAMIAKATFCFCFCFCFVCLWTWFSRSRPLAPSGCGALVYHCTLRFLLL